MFNFANYLPKCMHFFNRGEKRVSCGHHLLRMNATEIGVSEKPARLEIASHTGNGLAIPFAKQMLCSRLNGM